MSVPGIHCLLSVVVLTGVAEPSGHIVLRNEISALHFERAGGLFLARCSATGDAVVSPGRARPLVGIEFKRAGKGEWLRVTPESRTRIVAKAGPLPGHWQRKPEKPVPHRVEPERVSVKGDRLEVQYAFAVDDVGKLDKWRNTLLDRLVGAKPPKRPARARD